MAGREVRSGRSARDVVVVGTGPVAAGVLAAWGERARGVDEVPAAEPASVLAGARVVVLVAHPGDLRSVAGRRGPEGHAAAVAHAQRTFAAAREVRAEHVVVVTSALVHGAHPDRPVVHDDEPVLTGARAVPDGLVGHLLAVEAVVARASRRRSPRVTVVRPAAMVGRGTDTFVTRHFEAPRLLVVRGVERPWQLVHVDDVGAATVFAVEHGLTGALTVGPPDTLTPEQVSAAAGMRTVALAPATAFGTAERLHRVGVLPAPAAELAYVVYPWTVAADRLTAAGFEPRWSSAQALDVLLEGVRGRLALGGRRVERRDAAALGAAGAAVALLGTAAIWRQARRRG
ncbi:Rossmann-fold NAD(P)-binding domain-containing protein [Cellulomonas palmilytica]|uniref:nucleoside-diphosphate sugar epimerase n=1 Tax=Cellulomonas palmilytica TaxID=2608402 RepID=UPI001F315F88|nr:nucleoside-diphosphate sugar epimerase [Cellulomonas palmilytica]UJP39651.1 nucleoside-diphosphate sugar epimerase [Cellulomonas palmilytica]